MKKYTQFGMFSLLIMLFSVTNVNATKVTFKCYPGERNAEKDSIVYEYDSATGWFAEDFTLHQVNYHQPENRKEQFIKTGNKIGWRLWNKQGLHIYAKSNVKAITQIDILCEDTEYVDKLLQTSVGVVEYIGDLVVRISIPHTENVTNLELNRGIDDDEKFRPREITINYLVDGETYIEPTPLPTFFEPIAETYFRPWDVKIRTDEPNSTIYYTTDGTMPTTNSTVYTSPIYLDSDTQLKSITYKNGVASDVQTGQFNIRELPGTLEANSKYLIDFPNLKRTANNTLPIAQINIPQNFDPSKEHPLFVWFNGGNGSYQTNIPKKIIENTDFVVVGLPYRYWESPLGGGWRTSWDYHKTMLDSIETLIPNIDKDRRIVGGFSSGGAMVTQHLNFSNLAFQNYFSAFLPSGSAPHSSVPQDVLNSIEDLPMLISVGENDPRSPFVGQYYTLVEGHADATLNIVGGAGHSIYVDEPDIFPYTKDWIYGKVMVGSPLVSTEEIDLGKDFQLNIKGSVVEINNLNDYEGASIYISNLLGQQLQIEEIQSGNTSISLNQTIKPKTFYIASILKNGQFVYSKKFFFFD